MPFLDAQADSMTGERNPTLRPIDPSDFQETGLFARAMGLSFRGDVRDLHPSAQALVTLGEEGYNLLTNPGAGRMGTVRGPRAPRNPAAWLESVPGETIRTPAIRLRNAAGEWEHFEAPNHILAAQEASRRLGIHEDDVWRRLVDQDRAGGLESDGFITSAGRFVSREEAASIRGQSAPLRSEDLEKGPRGQRNSRGVGASLREELPADAPPLSSAITSGERGDLAHRTIIDGAREGLSTREIIDNVRRATGVRLQLRDVNGYLDDLVRRHFPDEAPPPLQPRDLGDTTKGPQVAVPSQASVTRRLERLGMRVTEVRRDPGGSTYIRFEDPQQPMLPFVSQPYVRIAPRDNPHAGRAGYTGEAGVYFEIGVPADAANRTGTRARGGRFQEASVPPMRAQSVDELEIQIAERFRVPLVTTQAQSLAAGPRQPRPQADPNQPRMLAINPPNMMFDDEQPDERALREPQYLERMFQSLTGGANAVH